MKKFIRNLFLSLLPIAVINVICWSLLVFLAWQDDLTYVNYASALDKEKRLEELADHSRLVIVGGSNTRFGFDCHILKDTLCIEPVNMGIHIGLGLNYMLEEVYDHLQKGDILLISAEYQHFLSMDTYVGDEGLTDMYLIKHEWYKAFRHMVDTHNYFSMYRLIRRRIKRIGMNSEDIPATMETRTKYNKYGDYIGHYNLPSPGFRSMLPFSINRSEEVLSDFRTKVFNLRNKGVEVLLLPPPFSQSSFQVNSLSVHRLSTSLEEAGVPFFIHPDECVYPDSLFYDSSYHLIREGVILHSRKIATALKKNKELSGR